MKLRFATPDDSAALLDIYARYIDTPVTFEYALPSEQEFAARIASIARFYPYLVCEGENGIAGYAYAHRFRERAAYAWGAELSAYLNPGATSRGLGKKLCLALLAMLKLQGVTTAYGCVTVPNPASEGMHASLGFRLVGTYRAAGYKNGIWHDIAWFEKAIADHRANPQPVIPVGHLTAESLEEILDSF